MGMGMENCERPSCYDGIDASTGLAILFVEEIGMDAIGMVMMVGDRMVTMIVIMGAVISDGKGYGNRSGDDNNIERDADGGGGDGDGDGRA